MSSLTTGLGRLAALFGKASTCTTPYTSSNIAVRAFNFNASKLKAKKGTQPGQALEGNRRNPLDAMPPKLKEEILNLMKPLVYQPPVRTPQQLQDEKEFFRRYSMQRNRAKLYQRSVSKVYRTAAREAFLALSPRQQRLAVEQGPAIPAWASRLPSVPESITDWNPNAIQEKVRRRRSAAPVKEEAIPPLGPTDFLPAAEYPGIGDRVRLLRPKRKRRKRRFGRRK
eukprot:TRINITY_DN9641_c0_g2_i1.p1 TRINITY_DN9641_c0_g2~~TRINITY_DN9641_c0_g2_i1.p1  ORF type:complete len:226 (+),score=23.64 TRINITY_DN9641_c0_g2_i1:320-997(+)